MSPLVLTTGSLLVLWGLFETLWTTLWTDGHAAPLSGRVASLTWKLVRLARPAGHRVLSLAGPLVFAATALVWILMLWVGWTLIFASDPEGLVSSSDGSRPSLAGTVWYAGYVLFTLGNGDFSPRTGEWQVASAFAAGCGILVVTLTVTYVLQVLSASVGSRSLASQILGLAQTPQDLLLAFWDGERFASLELTLQSWSSQLTRLTQQHLAYPILHFHHPSRAQHAHTLAIAVLDEALTMLALGVAPERRPAPGVLLSAREATRGFLETLASARLEPAPEPPPVPDSSKLVAAGVPLLEPLEFHGAFERERERRLLLLSMVEDAEWEWPGQAG